MTVRRLEQGDQGVGIAILLRVLEVLDLEQDVDLLARDDELGARLQDANQAGPRRTARRGTADVL